MPMPRKIRLMLLLCMGLLSFIASIGRNYLILLVYAWDIVDIFFALIAASLPTLNGVINAGISSLKTWASVSKMSVFGRFGAFGVLSQHIRGYDTRLSDREGKRSIRNGVARGKESTSPDPFQEAILAHEGDIELQRPANSHKGELKRHSSPGLMLRDGIEELSP
ncbi:hypothetical protein BDR22DRAFT_824635 [Usnea florida]